MDVCIFRSWGQCDSVLVYTKQQLELVVCSAMCAHPFVSFDFRCKQPNSFARCRFDSFVFFVCRPICRAFCSTVKRADHLHKFSSHVRIEIARNGSTIFWTVSAGRGARSTKKRAHFESSMSLCARIEISEFSFTFRAVVIKSSTNVVCTPHTRVHSIRCSAKTHIHMHRPNPP